MLGQLIPEVSDISAHSKPEAQGLGGAFMVSLYPKGVCVCVWGGQHLSLALSPELRDCPSQTAALSSLSACYESDGPFHSLF